MTLSKGSAQYALSFYAQRDAYPFGRFRLATIVSGREGAEARSRRRTERRRRTGVTLLAADR